VLTFQRKVKDPAVPGYPPYSYVHSKLFIIDDECVLIGSANVNRRSRTLDSEVRAAVADEVGGKSVQALRAALSRLHLGLPKNEDLRDWHTALRRGTALPATAKVEPYVPNPNLSVTAFQQGEWDAWYGGYLTPIEAAAKESGVKVTIALSRNAAEMERAIDAFAAEPNGA
jgi:phosphatidylserine/phosphatidylglycerophosphate/cardiolipin synthase-like enzyme